METVWNWAFTALYWGIALYLGYWLSQAQKAFAAILRLEAVQPDREAEFLMAMQSFVAMHGGRQDPGDAPRSTPHGSDPDRGSPIAGASPPPYTPLPGDRFSSMAGHEDLLMEWGNHDMWAEAHQAVLRG